MPPALVLWHVQRLPDTSLTSALQAGGWEFFGWGLDRHIAADVHDAIQFHSEVGVPWEKRPELPRWPRPTTADASAEKPKKKATVRDLWNRLKAHQGS